MALSKEQLHDALKADFEAAPDVSIEDKLELWDAIHKMLLIGRRLSSLNRRPAGAITCN